MSEAHLHALWQHLKRGGTSEPRAPRAVRSLLAVMTVLAAMLTLSMTALSVAVVATDGAVVDASSSPPSEVLWVVGFAALNCLLLLVAVYRIARARR